MSASRHSNKNESPAPDGLPWLLCLPSSAPYVTSCREVGWREGGRGAEVRASGPGPVTKFPWHREKVPSAGTGACVRQALLVCHGNPGCNRDRCHSGSEREAAFMGRLFWHCVRHTLQSITGKCLITDVVIKPEELCLYFSVFLLQGITKCLIKPPITLIFELGPPILSKMTSLQGLSS